MRQIINISLPPQLAEIVNQATSSGQFATKSEFFRNLIRQWSEKQLYQDLKTSQKEMKSTGGYLLKSLKDLR